MPQMASLIVLTAGGTGGHVFPAEALAGELVRRGFHLALITDARGDSYGGILGDVDTYRVRAGGVAGKGVLAKIRSVLELIVGTWQARGLLKKLKPKAVVGFGGYASVPTMLAACSGDYKTALHEQNAVLGRANRLLATRVDRIATSFENIQGIPVEAKSKVVRTGMPVRDMVITCASQPYPALAPDTPVRIMVMGGSMGARVMSDVVPAAIAQLPETLRQRLHITQQCRPEDIERVKTAYANMGVTVELDRFFSDIPERLAASHLLIARSGASTVAEVTVIGRPSVLVPYPHAIDNHQDRNAHAVDEAGAGWLIPETSFSPELLAKRLQALVEMPATLNNAAECSKAIGRADAVKELADLVCQLMGENGNGSGEGRKAA
jgi:UDP-N-acetylglucosamine--N-acetylmuramyl-(pentapeptide) pyrophosphoryl-undecaprenol N-acetylglucosamine transferase